MEEQSTKKVKVTSQEEGHFDIGHMHVQVLRSTFWLLALAVTILVIFSSVALLRNPSNRPIVNVFLGQPPSDVDSDQPERLKRGAEEQDKHAHMHLKRELLFESKRSGQMKTAGVKPAKAGHRKNKNVHKMKMNGTNLENRSKMKSKNNKEHRLNNTKTDNHNPHFNRTKRQEKIDKSRQGKKKT